MFQIGDLVEIDYPFYQIQLVQKQKHVSHETMEKIINEEKRFGIVLSEPMDTIDTTGKVYKNHVYCVYDVEQMIIYDRIGGLYLTSMM